MERTHGGDWAGFAARYGREPLDFSASISPLSIPEGVKEAICLAAAQADRYPDPRCTRLRTAIGQAQGVDPDMVLCGNGAAELIWRAVLAQKPRHALITAPSFGEYEAALTAWGCQVEKYPLDEDFRLDRGFLDRAVQADLVLVSQPNSPSGVTLSPGLVKDLAHLGTRLLLDECFVDFLDQPERYTGRGYLRSCPQLVILGAFTKLYGMAGVRLGYALSADRDFLAQMGRMGPPWSVSHLAQAAGLAALEEGDYGTQVRALVREERPRLLAGLEELGLRVVPGEANFLLFQSPVPLEEALGERGILLRRCDSLTGFWYRAAVRQGWENELLLKDLREVLTK